MARTLFYNIKTKDGNNYIGRMRKEDDWTEVDTDNESEDKEQYIVSLKKVDDFMGLYDVFVFLPTKEGIIPVEYSKMPGGANHLLIQVNLIAEINVIAESSKFAEALNSIKSGIITEPTPDLSGSSRFKKR